MSEENSNPPLQIDNDTAIHTQLAEISRQLTLQRQDVTELKEEVRGKNISVGKEVKKIKTDLDISWRRQGNKVQYTFNSDIIDLLKQANWAVDNNKEDYCKEVISEALEKVNHRQKLIRIADTSEAGWDTVNCYTSNPLASDSEDETKLRKAENQAPKKRKSKTTKRLQSSRKVPPSSTVTSGALFSYPSAFRSHPDGMYPAVSARGTRSFRGFNNFTPRSSVYGSCFGCGSFDHFRRSCPYSSGSIDDRSAQFPVKK